MASNSPDLVMPLNQILILLREVLQRAVFGSTGSSNLSFYIPVRVVLTWMRPGRGDIVEEGVIEVSKGRISKVFEQNFWI